MSQMSARNLEKMKEVLMEPDALGPEEMYFMIRGIPNITIWNPGKVGKEYVKTYGHYHKHNEPESYLVLHGEGIFLMQKMGKTDDEVVDIKIQKAKVGDVVDIPIGWGHVACNIGKKFLVTADNAPADAEHNQNDYTAIQRMHGFAYYILEENGKPALVKNPKYKKIPEINI